MKTKRIPFGFQPTADDEDGFELVRVDGWLIYEGLEVIAIVNGSRKKARKQLRRLAKR